MAGVSKAGQTRRPKLASDKDPAFGPQAERCRNSPCAVCVKLGIKQTTETHPHHEPPRGHRLRPGTDRDTVPLCRNHHNQRHRMGPVRFWTFHAIDWHALVERMREPCPPHSGTEGVPF